MNSKTYKKYLMIVLTAIIMMIAWAAILAVPFAYKHEIESETGSLAECGYIALKEHAVVRQQIEPDVDARIFLDAIKVIMLNLTGDENGEMLHVVIRRDMDNRKIKEIDYPLDRVVVGEWTEIPVHVMLGIDSHSIEFSVLGEAEPYLVTHAKELASPWNIQLYGDDMKNADSLAAVYDYRDVAPTSVRIYICFGIFVLFMCLLERMLCLESIENYKAIWGGILIVMSIPIILISVYSRPCVDDFSYSWMTHNLVQSGECNLISLLHTAWQVDKHFYFTWQGLYTAAFVHSLQPGIFGENLYWLGTVLLITFMVVILYITVTILCKHLCGNTKQSFYWTVLLTVTILQGMPSPEQGLYWFNGMMNYMPFVFLVMLNVVLMIEAEYCEQRWRRILFITLSCIVSFIISGGNHITSFLNILILFLMALALGVNKKFGSVLSLASAVIGFLIMYFAPGTAVRQATVETSGVLQTILEGGNQCLIDIRQWTNLQWVCYILLVLPLANEIIKNGRIKHARIHPVFLLLSSLALLAGMRCVPYFAIRNFGAGRSDNVIWIVYMLLSAVNVIYLLVWLWCRQCYTLEVTWSRITSVWTGIVLCFILCISGNFQNGESTAIKAFDELITGKAQKYAATYDERILAMESAPEDSVLHVRWLPYSELLGFDDITHDMDDWRNSSWARYYGVPTVTGFDRER